jgi:hypothetical protein
LLLDSDQDSHSGSAFVEVFVNLVLFGKPALAVDYSSFYTLFLFVILENFPEQETFSI